LPALTAGIQNQGLNNYVPKNNATILKNVISISANGKNTGATFYQNKEFTVLQDAYAIRWKDKNDILNDCHYLFLAGTISKAIYGNYEWTNKAGWERIKTDKIFLPITSAKKIDFDFIEEFIAELEERSVAELEAWLRAAGFEDCTLTEEELNAISEIEDGHLKWAEKEIVDDIFTVQNTHNILKENVVFRSGETPYVTASEGNNSIVSYISYKDEMKEEGNNILIGGKTLVITYQPNDFFSNDSHNLVLKPIAKAAKREDVQLFLTTSLYKSLSPKYSWGDSISKKKIKKDSLTLPVNSQGVPDYSKMATIISAVKKLVIKDVAEYANKKIRVAQQVIAK
jgi:hypothetical protein